MADLIALLGWKITGCLTALPRELKASAAGGAAPALLSIELVSVLRDSGLSAGKTGRLFG